MPLGQNIMRGCDPRSQRHILHMDLMVWDLNWLETAERAASLSATAVLKFCSSVFKSIYSTFWELLPSGRDKYKTHPQNSCSMCSECCTKQQMEFCCNLELTEPQKLWGAFCLLLSSILLPSQMRRKQHTYFKPLGTRGRTLYRYFNHIATPYLSDLPAKTILKSLFCAMIGQTYSCSMHPRKVSQPGSWNVGTRRI